MTNLPIPPQLFACARLLLEQGMSLTEVAWDLGASRGRIAAKLNPPNLGLGRRVPQTQIRAARAASGLGDYLHGPKTDERILALRQLMDKDSTPFTSTEVAFIHRLTRSGFTNKEIYWELRAKGLDPSMAKITEATRLQRNRTHLSFRERCELRRLREQQSWTTKALMKKFGCSESTVRKVIREPRIDSPLRIAA